ncbi:MAG: type II toxin-antitoxin system VapB family antitoxin [Planctomycetes bacterium]|jgi:hypothetical protein|nr:type II toxin-antitoxin system VapB family antitoxin [Planctomycetota bacterium]
MNMRTTVEIPDELFRKCKATAALRGASLKDVVREALEEYLRQSVPGNPAEAGWRRVFGRASKKEVATVDAAVEADLERVRPEDWQ